MDKSHNWAVGFVAVGLAGFLLAACESEMSPSESPAAPPSAEMEWLQNHLTIGPYDGRDDVDVNFIPRGPCEATLEIKTQDVASPPLQVHLDFRDFDPDSPRIEEGGAWKDKTDYSIELTTTNKREIVESRIVFEQLLDDPKGIEDGREHRVIPPNVAENLETKGYTREQIESVYQVMGDPVPEEVFAPVSSGIIIPLAGNEEFAERVSRALSETIRECGGQPSRF